MFSRFQMAKIFIFKNARDGEGAQLKYRLQMLTSLQRLQHEKGNFTGKKPVKPHLG